MSLVERFLRIWPKTAIRAGSLTSVKQLTDAITPYLAERNENPEPNQWKADGEKILAKIHRARRALEGAWQIDRLFETQHTSVDVSSFVNGKIGVNLANVTPRPRRRQRNPAAARPCERRQTHALGGGRR